jgi:hypothetical protein
VQSLRCIAAGHDDSFPPMTTGLICLPQPLFLQYATCGMLLMFLLKTTHWRRLCLNNMHYHLTTHLQMTFMLHCQSTTRTKYASKFSHSVIIFSLNNYSNFYSTSHPIFTKDTGDPVS